jgi:hypothetical protein
MLIPNFVVLNVNMIYSFMKSVFGLNFPHLMVKICLLVTIIYLLMSRPILLLIIFILEKANLTLIIIGLFNLGILIFRGTRWRSWLRHCATNRTVAGSIPDGLTGIFQ